VNEIDIIIKALKMEAEKKPNERIYLDFKSYTYKEFINMLDNYEKLNNDEKQFVDKFLEESVRLFKENKAFREKILSMV
jgi:ribosome assembly protein YihI (activator of Der GTPase)